MIPRFIARDLIEPVLLFLGRWIIRIVTLGRFFPNPKNYTLQFLIGILAFVVLFVAFIMSAHYINLWLGNSPL